MHTIAREQLKRRLEESGGVVLVDVLSPEAYHEFHLPHAINVPWAEDFDKKIQRAVPNKKQAIVVYCLDQHCTAAPQAAERMELLGYNNVYDYQAGKMDWKSAGLPVEA